MSDPRADRIPFAKITTVLAVAFGGGLGCVVLGSVFAAPAPCFANCEKFDVGPVASVGLALMFFSAICLGLTAIVWVFAGMIGSLSIGQADSQTTRLFDDRDDEDKPKI